MTGTYAFEVQRFLIGRVLATSGALVALLGTFVPWLRSGTRRRNSYDIFSLVDRIGFSRSGAVGWGLRLWPIVPFLLAVAVTLQWFPRRWLTPASAGFVAVVVGGVALAVRSAPTTSFIAAQEGPIVTLVGAVLLAAGALLTGSARHRETGAPRAARADGRS
jgi:hypothetical protein